LLNIKKKHLIRNFCLCSLNRPEVIDELITFITTEPPIELDEKQRFLYPNVACEILTSDLTSIKQRIAADENLMNKLYNVFEDHKDKNEQINPLIASFVCKTLGTLITKKMEQDWFSYQTICLHVLEYIKSKDNFLDVMLHHFATPVVMDLLLTILNECEDQKMKNIFLEWINEKGLIEKMIDLLSVPNESDKHVMIAQFLIEILKIGRCNRQSDTEDRKNAPNPLLQRMEESQTTTRLIDTILCDTRTESGILSGLQVLLCLLENSIIQEPVSQTALQQIIDAEKEHHDEIIASLMNIVHPRVQQLFELLLNPPAVSIHFNLISICK
jgi:serine/threonine-protein phosphatase 6 regulatory subunit 3